MKGKLTGKTLHYRFVLKGSSGPLELAYEQVLDKACLNDQPI